MADLQKIKAELIGEFKAEDKSIIENAKKELDKLSETEGLEGMNNLEAFYGVWLRHRMKEPSEENQIHSWAAVALGLTKKKPYEDFLPFRRAFARAGFPDIDTDFDDERRGEIYEYLIEKYGREMVGNIGTYTGLKMKTAIRQVAKACDVANAFNLGSKECKTRNHLLASEINETLPVGPTGVIRWHDHDGQEVVIKKLKDAYLHIPDFKEYMDKYPEVLKHAKLLEGNVSNFGKHAAGVVIGNVELGKLAPLRQGRNGLATQFAMDDLESIGLIKFDILAIAALTVIRDASALIKTNYDIDLDMKNLPLEDEKTLDLYRSGRLNGVFQCENGGMQRTMRDIGVTGFRDVMAAIALYRPGPMDSIPEYVSRKKGHSKVDYFHKTIEPYTKPYLEPTHGVLVYQEQVMQICNALAGLSVAEGYVMIKAIGKKKQHLMDRFAGQFVSGCVANGVPENIAQQYWQQFITPFASYGFNASHSCCYAYLSFQTAYLKANFPDEFTAAFMNTFMSRAMNKGAQAWDQVTMMEKDGARTSGVKILPRDLDKSELKYKIVTKKNKSGGAKQTEIRPPICCKGIGYESAKNIFENQPYNNDLRLLAEKTDTKKVTVESIDALCEAGFIDGIRGKKNKEKVKEQFSAYRDNVKSARRKGLDTTDIFENL